MGVDGPASGVSRPNVLFVMTDQQRFDTVAALGNHHIYTPNLDRLVRRGTSFTRAYSTCPVCVPARYTIRTGCEPTRTLTFNNGVSPEQTKGIENRCGTFLARRMSQLGYRTFGIGKFHTTPWNQDVGYDVARHAEEIYASPEQRRGDAYAAWIAGEHPEFDYVEALMGERTEMYHMPQMSPMPAEFTVERWAADRAIDQINASDSGPYFGFVSFIGPHPPFAPPLPFNRMYDPDRMPSPIGGRLEVDHMDEQIPWMNYQMWGEDIGETRAKILKARYYGEISYIDDCIGRLLDAVEARPDTDNTLICFFADHGDHLGDHHAWQKESFFEASCHVPFLLSWPGQLPENESRDDLVCLTDLFGIATRAAGAIEARDGIDILGSIDGTAPQREFLVGCYERPGTPYFKIMVRDTKWKYIYMANGGREQLFEMAEDPHEQHNLTAERPAVKRMLREIAIRACDVPGASSALDNGDLRAFAYQARKLMRAYQFDSSRGVLGFPSKPEDVLAEFRKGS